jgi:hypothetical protein
MASSLLVAVDLTTSPLPGGRAAAGARRKLGRHDVPARRLLSARPIGDRADEDAPEPDYADPRRRSARAGRALEELIAGLDRLACRPERRACPGVV